MKQRRIITLWVVLIGSLVLTGLHPAPLSAAGGTEPHTATADYHLYVPLVMRNFAQTTYPNDARYGEQWALEKIGAPYAWTVSRGANVLVAVLDSGADLDHPDLAGKLRTDIDYDFVNDDEVAMDDANHGTHVAGILAAATDNTIGVAGLGWETTIVPYKVLDDTGNGSLSDIVEAIDRAVADGAKVINMSLGSSPGMEPCSHYPSLYNALENAYDHGVLVVVAAGNDATDAATVIPANCPYVLTVSATDANDDLADFSNYGSVIDVSAPGTSILSTLWVSGGTYHTYGWMSGTSMATPYVSALAALVYARHPGYTPDQVASAILDRAVDLGNPNSFGCGRIDAREAVFRGAAGAAPQCRSHALAPAAASTRPMIAQSLTAEVLHVPAEQAHRSGILIVKWRSGVPNVGALSRAYGLTPLKALTDGSWLMRVKTGTEAIVARFLMRSGLVDYVTYDYLLTAQ